MANKLPTEKKIMIASMLCEGGSIRAIERMTGVHRDTIMRLGVRMGEGCAYLQDKKMRGLHLPNVQVDELWGFIGAKAKTVREKKLTGDVGNVWVWTALDADTKLVPSYVVGDRDSAHANLFLRDLASRLTNRPQISSDAFNAYPAAINAAFYGQVDYGTVIKTFTATDLDPGRYSPPDVLKVKKEAVQGFPDMKLCSTSFVEKHNHTTRMHCRRLSRLTNAFSKKRENFEAAIGLHYAYYNFVKKHGTIKTTPAVAAGIEKSAWTVEDLVESIEG